MSKKMLKNSIIYTFGDFISIAVSGFLLLPFYTRALTQTEFGIFSIVNTWVTILTFIVHFGIISTYSRLYFNQQNEYEKKVFTGQIILLHIFMVVPLLLFMSIFQNIMEETFFKSIDNNYYYYYIIIVSILSFINALYSIYLRINEQAERFLFFQLSSVVTYILLIFTFQTLIENTLDAIILAAFCSSFIMWILSILNLKYIFSLDNILITSKKVLHFSLPIFVGYLMYFLLNKFNILYLQYYDNLDNIALFSFAFQLSSVLTIFAGSIGKAIQPILYKAEKKYIRAKVREIAIYYKVVMSLVLIMFFLLSEYFISFFAPESYGASKEAFLVLSVSVFIYNFRSVESLLFMYFHKPRYSLYTVSIGALTVLIFSFVLVHRYGYIGSSYAILMGSIMAYIANKYYSYKLTKLECT